ncbi:MAG: response regulator [Nitrospirae bacterium]|nr:response regulator [Nitrospirota bacterium]
MTQRLDSAAEAVLARRTRRLNIVIVDDDPDDRLLAREALDDLAARGAARAGNATLAADGHALLSHLKRAAAGKAPWPDLVLLDWNMPGMNGADTLAALKADPRYAAIPVVVVSTSHADADIADAYRLGGSAFVTKANHFADVVDTLGRILTFWTGTALPPPRHGEDAP